MLIRLESEAVHFEGFYALIHIFFKIFLVFNVFLTACQNRGGGGGHSTFCGVNPDVFWPYWLAVPLYGLAGLPVLAPARHISAGSAHSPSPHAAPAAAGLRAWPSRSRSSAPPPPSPSPPGPSAAPPEPAVV